MIKKLQSNKYTYYNYNVLNFVKDVYIKIMRQFALNVMRVLKLMVHQDVLAVDLIKMAFVLKSALTDFHQIFTIYAKTEKLSRPSKLNKI